jgi:tetratricopeptide (TPR) repeat protein
MKLESDSNMTTAKRFLALGFAFRDQFRLDEAIDAFQKARNFAMEDMGPVGQNYAFALWALADAHAHHANFRDAENFYMQALRALVRSHGPGSPEARACIDDLRELFQGFTRKSKADVARIEGMLAYAKMI